MANAAGRGSSWLTADAEPLFGLRLSVSRYPWRIGPAWAVLAGALAAGAPISSGTALLRLLGAVLLADAVWGGLWGMMALGAGRAQPEENWGLPYTQPGAPLLRLSRRLSELASGTGCHELLAGAILSLGLAALFGWVALLLAVMVLVCAVWAQLVCERGRQPALPHALLAVGLPWALGLVLAGPGSWFGPGPGPLALGLAFTVLQWGAQRARLPGTGVGLGIWFGQGAILAVLAAARLPWAVCIAAALFLPPSWWLLRAGARARQLRPAAEPMLPGSRQALQHLLAVAMARSAIWWWLVLMLAAVALRQLVLA